MMWTVSAALMFCGMLKLVSSCPKVCRCSEAQRCAPGVSLVPDSCGCCTVCAQQLNEECSAMEPCDHSKGLKCNFGAGYGAAQGICRAKSDGRSCEYNDKIYQNGESFRPNCKHQCTCMDGAVACASLCPREVALPRLGCQKHRLVDLPGRCCKQRVCSEKGKRWSLLVKEHSWRENTPKNELTNGNELPPVSIGGYGSLPVLVNGPEVRMLFGRGKCQVHRTAWSPCSKSCGKGVSSRLSNSNSQCQPKRETRICEVRTCTQTAFPSLKGSQKCNPTEKADTPVKLFHKGCGSMKEFQIKYCGSCSKGLCCHPHRTHTVPVLFRCQDGRTFSKNVMMIQSCKCDPTCPHHSSASSGRWPPAFYRHINGIH